MRSCVGPMYSPPASAITPAEILWLSVRPPTRSRASSTHTSLPLRARARAALSPAKPAPTITTSTLRCLRLRFATAVAVVGSQSAAPAAPAAPIRPLRVSCSSKGGETLTRDLEQSSGGAEVGEQRGAEPLLCAPALVDVAEDGDLRLLGLDRLEDRLAAEALVQVALRRRVHDEDASVGAGFQLARRLLVGQVEAPVPRRGGHPGAESEEAHAGDLDSVAVEDVRRFPAVARRAQGVDGLVVAGHEDRRALDRLQGADRLLEALVDRGEVAGGDDHVGLGGALHKSRALVEVAVDVAEAEEVQGIWGLGIGGWGLGIGGWGLVTSDSWLVTRLLRGALALPGAHC